MINKQITRICLGAATLILCSCAYSPQPGGNTEVTSPRDSHNTRDSHDVTTVTMAPGSTYAPTIMKGSDIGNENEGYGRYDGYRFDPGATRFARREDGVVRVAPNCNPNFPGY
ncbi:MAG: hypothetical protein ACOYM3_20440 [Terrimicrobiaceae bacterium]